MAAIDEKAQVTDVKKPGDANFDTFTIEKGDKVAYSKHVRNDDGEALEPDQTYHLFVLTKSDGSQAFIRWGDDIPMLVETLSRTRTVVETISPGNTLKEGDNATVSTQKSDNGGTWVTIDTKRGTEQIATFSFDVK